MSPRRFRRIAIAFLVSALAVFGLAMPASAAVTGQTIYNLPPSGSSTRALTQISDGRYAYATGLDQKIHKFDMATRTYVASSSLLPSVVRFMNTSPNGQILYATVQDISGLCGLLYLRASDLSQLGCADLSFEESGATYASSPGRFVINPEGTRAYVIGSDSGGIHVVDLTAADITHAQIEFLSLTETANFGLNERLAQIAITPDGSKLFVTERDWFSFDPTHNRVFVLNTSNIAVPATPIQLSAPFDQPVGVAVSPDSKRVYVSDAQRVVSGIPHGDNNVFVFDASSLALVATVDATSSEAETSNNVITVSPDSSQFVVSNERGLGELQFFSASSLQRLYTFLPGEIDGATFSPQVNNMFFAPDGASLLLSPTGFNGFSALVIDPPLPKPKPALAATGTNAAPIFIGAGILVLLGVAFAAYAIVLRKRRND